MLEDKCDWKVWKQYLSCSAVSASRAYFLVRESAEGLFLQEGFKGELWRGELKFCPRCYLVFFLWGMVLALHVSGSPSTTFPLKPSRPVIHMCYGDVSNSTRRNFEGSVDELSSTGPLGMFHGPLRSFLSTLYSAEEYMKLYMVSLGPSITSLLQRLVV